MLRDLNVIIMTTITMMGRLGTGHWIASQCKGVDQGHEAKAETEKGKTEAFLNDKDGKAKKAKKIQKNRETTAGSRSKSEKIEGRVAVSLTINPIQSRSATCLQELNVNSWNRLLSSSAKSLTWTLERRDNLQAQLFWHLHREKQREKLHGNMTEPTLMAKKCR